MIKAQNLVVSGKWALIEFEYNEYEKEALKTCSFKEQEELYLRFHR